MRLPDPLITRDEIIKQLHKLHFDVTEWQLKSWVTYGILPRPERRLPPGATDGVARAVYPTSMLSVICLLLIEQRRGASREQLKEMTPEFIKLAAEALEVDTEWSGTQAEKPSLPPPRIPRAVERAVWAYAEQLAEHAGQRVTHAMITFYHQDGRDVTVAIGPPPPSRKANNKETVASVS